MPANLDLLSAFADAISGDSVALQTTSGTLEVKKSEFELAFTELAELRSVQGDVDEGADYARDVVEQLVDLVEQAQEQNASAIPTEMVAALLEQPEDEPEPVEGGFAPHMVGLARDLLRSLGVGASDETGSAFLAALAQGAADPAAEPGRHRAPEPEPVFEPVQQLMQPRAAAPVPKVRLRGGRQAPNGRAMVPPNSLAALGRNRANPILPANGVPIPANPAPHRQISAEELFGLRRSPSGRYDSGPLDME